MKTLIIVMTLFSTLSLYADDTVPEAAQVADGKNPAFCMNLPDNSEMYYFQITDENGNFLGDKKQHGTYDEALKAGTTHDEGLDDENDDKIPNYNPEEKITCGCIKEDRSISLKCEDPEVVTQQYLFGDMNIAGGEKCTMSGGSLGDGGSKDKDTRYDSNPESGVLVVCQKDSLYSTNGDLTSTEMKFIKSESKSPLQTVGDLTGLVNEPYQTCTKWWGQTPFIKKGMSAPTDPRVAYMCAIGEAADECNQLMQLYRAVETIDVTKFDTLAAVYNEKDDAKAMAEIEKVPTFEKVAAFPGLTVSNEITAQKMGDRFIPVVTFSLNANVGGNTQMNICGVDASGNVDGRSCKENLLKTILGFNDENAVGYSNNGAMIVAKNILGDNASFRTIKSCRSDKATEYARNYVIPCKGFQAIASLNKYNMQKEVFVSFDNKYRCEKDDAFAADYKFCKRVVTAYNGFAVIDSAGKAAEQISMGQARLKATQKLEEAAKARNEGTLGEGESVQSIAVDAQKDIYTRKITHEWSKVGLYGANAATLGGLLFSWPTPKRIGKKCKDDGTNNQCCNFAAARYFDKVFPNYAMKKNFTYQAVVAAGKSASAGILAHLYKKHRDSLEAIKDEIDNIEAEEYTGIQAEELIQLCNANPMAPACRTRGQLIEQGPAGHGQISFNGAGGTPIDQATASIDPIEYGIGTDSGNLSDEDKELLNSQIESPTGTDSSFSDNPSAARFVKSPGGGGGGGGGGGSAGGASAPGLGGAAKKSDAKDKMAFGEGGRSSSKKRGGFAYSGGYRYGTGKKDSNPFNKLFGKGKKGGVSVNRGVASDISSSGSGLFTQISKRYTKVNDAKRLMEYEEE